MPEETNIPPIRDDGLQLRERPRLQAVFWTVQRVAWVGFGVICLLALLGFTGSGGPFHMQRVTLPGMEVEVPRVTRWEGADTMTLHLAGPGDHVLTMGQPFFDRFGIERMQPEPVETLLVPGGQQLRFRAEGPGDHLAHIDLRANRYGWVRFDLTAGGQTRSVRTLVLP